MEKGAGRGRKLGFPTMNIATDNQILPPGVFHTRIEIGGRLFASVTNIGMRPDVPRRGQRSPLKVETHIPGFQRMVYGKKIRLHFIDKIREERKFASARDLVEQIRQRHRLPGHLTKERFFAKV